MFENQMCELRDVWEETSYQLELLQANESCVKQERKILKERKMPPYVLNEKVKSMALQQPSVFTGQIYL